MGFVWVHVGSFLHNVASPFHSFVTTGENPPENPLQQGKGVHHLETPPGNNPQTTTRNSSGLIGPPAVLCKVVTLQYTEKAPNVQLCVVFGVVCVRCGDARPLLLSPWNLSDRG